MTRRLLAGSSLACLTVFFLAAAAFAHASLLAADPDDGATLETTPYTLSATFDEELDRERSSIVVENAAGTEVARGGVSADDDTVMTAELPALEPGEYTVRWTAVTPDDQAVERGTYTFNVALSPTPQPTAPPAAADSGTDVLLALALAAVGIGIVLAFVFLRGRR
jgi:methionine-rich copper-binding protein CopC